MMLAIAAFAVVLLCAFMWHRGRPCDRCGTDINLLRRRMSTAYVHDESNYTTQCPECFEDTEEYWAGMWADYYSSRL